MKKVRIRKYLVLMVMMLIMAAATAMTASAGVNFNSTNYIALKRNKKKSAKLKGLTKKQKKKKWTFKSSDTSIVKVKRSGKYGYKLTANKKKDGYAVIRATQSKTAIYLLVRVGKGSTSTNGTTRAWAAYGRSHYRPGTSAYNTWNKVVNPNSGSSGSSGGSGSGSTGSGSTGSGSGSSSSTTDWYATHPQYTNVHAVYGARDNKMVPTPATSVVGKDQNGYGYDSNGIIGTDRNGKKIKGIIPPITFTIETIPWFDQYLKSFDNGYYTGNGGPNYIGKNVIFTSCGLSTNTMGIVKITTSAPIDNASAKALHGVKVDQRFIDGSGKGSPTAGQIYDDWSAAIGGTPAVGGTGLTIRKMNGAYYDFVCSEGTSGTYRYSVTIDGVTKHVDFKIVDHVTEFKNWYIHKYDSIPQAEVNAGIEALEKIGVSRPAAVAEASERINILHGPEGTSKMCAYVYKSSSDVRRGIPSFIATDVFKGTGTLFQPGCSLGLAYSNYASDAIKEHHDISPGYWNTVTIGGSGHVLTYNAIWYNGDYTCYPYFYSG